MGKMLRVAALAALLAACSSSHLNNKHPLVKKEATTAQVAMVYFIRPRTERFMGPADNRLKVEADRFHLMDIAKGEYTLLPMVPGNVWITVTNLTAWGPQNRMKEMSRSRQFRFLPGETYYLVFQVVDGEFRGVFFRPALVDANSARDLSRHMKPVGMARKAPLS
ncbi:MAG: hypothetical protein ACE5ET_05955 [Gammaproteobacteria bacterium]